MSLKVAIIGAAGTLGACTAYRLATLGLVDEMVMIDMKENLLKSHIMDIETAITGMHDIELRQGDDHDLTGADIVIVTAGAPWRVVSSRIEKLVENIPIIRDIAKKVVKYCPEAVVITSTNPVDPLNMVMQRFSGSDHRRILGYTQNDTTRFLKLTAKALGVSSTRLQGTVIGEHGDTAVLLFSSLRLDGAPVDISEDLKMQIRNDHKNTLKASIALRSGWTSGWTSSVGLARMVEAIAQENDQIIPCSVYVDGEYGIDGISIGVPVKLGRRGVREVVQIELAQSEAEELRNSAAYVKSIVREMDSGLEPVH
jgi:malate/lactate dehydrogenase